ncbi:valine--pyruvate transaminase [bacterium]|nr:valine--pyruvate transaminase [bacterium]
MKFSQFGLKFTQDAGILSLMEDLGHALTVNQNMMMLGGGNPGKVPGVVRILQKRLADIAKDPESVYRLLGIYDPPQGNVKLIRALVKLFNDLYEWPIQEENVCLTNGSQSAFFMLFNLMAGQYPDESFKKIQFPLTPEYIGYADEGITPHIFTASKPRIEMQNPPFFKYHVDFDRLSIDDRVAAICVSRPTNPTGNMLTDDEINKLDRIARENQIPLIIDNAYGVPFPQIVYQKATPFWNDNTILCMSLSKLGLPSVRTGIVIGPAEITQALAKMNAILTLSPVGVGSQLVLDLVESGDICRISREVIQPFYRTKMQQTVQWIQDAFSGLDYAIHQPEGAMFLWLWFPNLPVSSLELYERLKQKGVLVVSGHYFFPGLSEDWDHTAQCIRMTYSQENTMVKRGIEIMAETLREL